MREFEASGKTIDEAIQNGLKKLGVSRDDVSIEVLRTPQRGFLGIGGQDAVVKLTLTGMLAQELEKIENAEKEREREIESQAHAAEPERKKVRTQPDKAEKEDCTDMPVRPDKAGREPGACPDKPERAAENDVPGANTQDVAADAEPVPQDKIDLAEAFLSGVFEKMQVKVEPQSINGKNGRLEVTLEGDDLGVIIGRRGETLDALQYLTSIVINRGSDKYTRVSIDAQNYRKKREETLVRLANRLAGRVKNSRRNVTLEPMTAYERRIIHSTIQGIDGVTTFSTGTDPNRRVVITLEGRERRR